MKNTLRPLLFSLSLLTATAIPGLQAVESTAEIQQPTRSRAFFNPKVSSRDIAMNQTILVRFTTLRPQLEDVDPRVIIDAALSQGETAANWRLLGKPVIVDNEKVGTLNISFSLLPRVSGDVPLPEIPVRWLRGNQIASFGNAQVVELLSRGTNTKPLSSDHLGIGGYDWGTSYTEILRRTGQKSGVVDNNGDFVVSTTSGLELIIRGSRLAAARIKAKGINAEQARQAFLDRWGDAQSSNDPQVTKWIIGWVRIEARTIAAQQIVIELTHEGIEAEIARQEIEDKVFDLLDGGASSATTQPAVTTTPAQAAARPTIAEKPIAPDTEEAPAKPVIQKALDVEAAFKRQLERAKNIPVE